MQAKEKLTIVCLDVFCFTSGGFSFFSVLFFLCYVCLHLALGCWGCVEGTFFLKSIFVFSMNYSTARIIPCNNEMSTLFCSDFFRFLFGSDPSIEGYPGANSNNSEKVRHSDTHLYIWLGGGYTLLDEMVQRSQGILSFHSRGRASDENFPFSWSSCCGNLS